LYVYRPNIENLTQTPFITRYYLNLSKILEKSIFRVLPQNSNFARFLRTVALKTEKTPQNFNASSFVTIWVAVIGSFFEN
jgi:hypothetical protein